AGMLAGIITGYLHTKLKIPAILSGILTMIALYSINLRIMGQANTPLLGESTVISIVKGFLPAASTLGLKDSTLQNWVILFVGLVFAAVMIGILYWFFGTELGSGIRATGSNEAMVRAQGEDTDRMKIYGLVISNGLIALSGGLVTQTQGYADVGMGVGAIVVGLASIVIGEVILHKKISFAAKLTSIVLGSVIYRIVIAVVLQLGLNTNDMKLLTAIIVTIALSVPVLKKNKVIIAISSFIHRVVNLIKRKLGIVNTINEKQVLKGVNLQLNPGDFVSIIGGNGAGKSTMLNMIAGVHFADMGSIVLDGVDITLLPEYVRAQYLGRVFQDPMMGTAADMEIEENLALAYRRGKKRGFRWGITKEEKEIFVDKLKTLDLGLETRLTSKVGLLSGGQRQALTLLMATLQKPKLLLLDEHTAALDPKTANKVLELTDQIVAANSLTALMVTHNMKNAIQYGNRLIMMHQGNIIYDVAGEEKKKLQVTDLLSKFEMASGEEFANDRMILS
ncbi:MAG: Methionine transporter ATP-binding protein, partial [Anaerocolumna sp.]|nr:Methionine transporter ATP-binding protein [Anaerocolumna sp.]